VSGVVIDRLSGRHEAHSAWPMLQVPRLWDAAWETEAVTLDERWDQSPNHPAPLV